MSIRLGAAVFMVTLALFAGLRAKAHYQEEGAQQDEAHAEYLACLQDPACDYKRADKIRDHKLNQITGSGSLGWSLATIGAIGAAGLLGRSWLLSGREGIQEAKHD